MKVRPEYNFAMHARRRAARPLARTEKSNVSLSVQIMAHHDREDLVERLIDRLGLTADHVTWDTDGTRWHTGRQAWLAAAERKHDWSLVIQDDVLVCDDLIEGLETGLARIPRRNIASLFIPKIRPNPQAFEKAETQANAVSASWLSTRGIASGQAIAAPTSTVHDMAQWCDRLDIPWYDGRVGRHYRRIGYSTLYPWPSLVDHADVPSLIGHEPGRVARGFVGESYSALNHEWGGPVVNVGMFR